MNWEVYKLTCCTCHRTIEVPAATPMTGEVVHCPSCGSRLTIEWGSLFGEAKS